MGVVVVVVVQLLIHIIIITIVILEKRGIMRHLKSNKKSKLVVPGLYGSYPKVV